MSMHDNPATCVVHNNLLKTVVNVIDIFQFMIEKKTNRKSNSFGKISDLTFGIEHFNH